MAQVSPRPVTWSTHVPCVLNTGTVVDLKRSSGFSSTFLDVSPFCFSLLARFIIVHHVTPSGVLTLSEKPGSAKFQRRLRRPKFPETRFLASDVRKRGENPRGTEPCSKPGFASMFASGARPPAHGGDKTGGAPSPDCSFSCARPQPTVQLTSERRHSPRRAACPSARFNSNDGSCTRARLPSRQRRSHHKN